MVERQYRGTKRQYYSSRKRHLPNSIPNNPFRVTIIGAGKVGSTLAQKIIEKNLADVTLLGRDAQRMKGLALDLTQASALEHHNCRIAGTSNYKNTDSSDIVVICAGLPRKPGMSRDDLTKINAEIVIEAAQAAVTYSPNAIFIIVTNPLDPMTYLAFQATGLPRSRVIGMAGVLDSARFQAFIAMELGVRSVDVSAMVLGSHGDLMVPLPHYSTVNQVSITKLMDAATIEQLVARTRRSGAEIVELLQTGSAYFAPASSIYQMIEAILLNQSRTLPVAAYLQGEYGLEDVVVGVPCRLGRFGVEQILELHLTDAELAALHASANAVRQNIGQTQKMLAVAA